MGNKFLLSVEVKKFIRDKSPKIAILAPSLDTVPSQQGGAIYCLIEDIAFYSAYPIIVFSKFKHDLRKSKISNRIIYYTEPIKKTVIQSLIGHRLRKKIYGISGTENIQYANDVYQFCIKNQIKCLVVEDSNSLLAGVPDNPDVPIILHQHANALLGHSLHYFQKFTKKLSGIIFVSETNRKDVNEKFGNLKIPNTHIYNGVNLKNFISFTTQESGSLRNPFISGNKTIILLFAGRIHPSKGIKELLCSFEFLKEFDIKVLIAGDLETQYDYNSAFENEIKFLMTGKTILLGTVPQERLPQYYALCDFVIVPSTGPEGLPKVVTEALVMGKPVIASNRGGIMELVINGKNGIIIEEPISPENIAKAIIGAIKNKEIITSNAHVQQEIYRSRFSAESMAAQFDDFLRNYL